ncbi:Immunoglobulin domain-containing protein oig-1-like [Homarus americanus]|uniref:Immunoglobulin domain-containing protein oig-1-like n=1 Tax=Homarus americanus TaxID=6706 RepID=A0A8J5T7P4_HOMAM|nr:Immunoglobulin domain-containing protein oig-1-like [Homarus americanus]
MFVPKATILHAPELYTDEGGALNLTCVVSPSPAPPEYIFWYHRGEVINYESDRTVRVSVRQEDGRTVSTLLVARAALDHSGLYQCAPSNTKRASIMVHVFKGKGLGGASGHADKQQHVNTAWALPLPPAARCCVAASPVIPRRAGHLGGSSPPVQQLVLVTPVQQLVLVTPVQQLVLPLLDSTSSLYQPLGFISHQAPPGFISHQASSATRLHQPPGFISHQAPPASPATRPHQPPGLTSHQASPD